MGLLALFGPFTDRNDRFPYLFMYSTNEIPNPFRAEPSRIGHYRGTFENSLWSPPFLGSRIECLRHKLARKNRTRVLMFSWNFLCILRWSELPLGNALRRWFVKAGTHKNLSVRKVLFDWWILARTAGWGHINFDDMRGDIDCNVCQWSNLCWSGVLAKTCGVEYSLRNSCF